MKFTEYSGEKHCICGKLAELQSEVFRTDRITGQEVRLHICKTCYMKYEGIEENEEGSKRSQAVRKVLSF